MAKSGFELKLCDSKPKGKDDSRLKKPKSSQVSIYLSIKHTHTQTHIISAEKLKR